MTAAVNTSNAGVRRVKTFIMKLQAMPIKWEKGPEETIVGDVFDTLSDGTPRQWAYQIWPIEVDGATKWRVKQCVYPHYLLLDHDGIESEDDAKSAAFDCKVHVMNSMLKEFAGIEADGIRIASSVIALPGTKVMALNYRCKPPRWEEGTVEYVKVDVSKDGTSSPSYDVFLDRKAPGGGGMWLHLGDSGISLSRLYE